MKKLMSNEHGFIPLILTILVLILAVIIFAYLRVRAQQQTNYVGNYTLLKV